MSSNHLKFPPLVSVSCHHPLPTRAPPNLDASKLSGKKILLKTESILTTLSATSKCATYIIIDTGGACLGPNYQLTNWHVSVKDLVECVATLNIKNDSSGGNNGSKRFSG